MRRTLASIAIVLGVGLFVLGAAGWKSYGPTIGGIPRVTGTSSSAGWSIGSERLMAAGAMLVVGGILARRA